MFSNILPSKQYLPYKASTMATLTERALAYFIGDYDYSTLCMPQVPWAKEKPKMQFFARNERLPILMAAIMGLQHAFAMVGGLITPPYVVMKVRFSKQ